MARCLPLVPSGKLKGRQTQASDEVKMAGLALVKKQGDGTLGATNATSGKGEATRKEKQAARLAEKEQEILDEAAKIGKYPKNAQERLVLAKANKIKTQRELRELEEEQGRILAYLGDFNRVGAEEEFAKDFAGKFIGHQYECPISTCTSGAESVKWVLPLAILVRKTLDKKGDKSTFNWKNHGEQWNIAARLFGAPEDLQGLVICEKHRPGTEAKLEVRYPQDHPGNHKLHHLEGFTVQLGKNRYRVLREGLKTVEDEILEIAGGIEEIQEETKKLEKKAAQEIAEEEEIDSLIS